MIVICTLSKIKKHIQKSTTNLTSTSPSLHCRHFVAHLHYAGYSASTREVFHGKKPIRFFSQKESCHFKLRLLFSLKLKEMAKMRLLAIWKEKNIVISNTHNKILEQKNFTGSGFEEVPKLLP